MNARDLAVRSIEASIGAKRLLLGQAEQIARMGEAIADVLAAGGKVLLCGNGGSAADCQHIAAELVGRFSRERRALPAIALTVDTSALTAIANDYSFDRVFARQVEALGRKGDALVAISTSGRSPNVLEALRAARGLGIRTFALTGEGGRGMEADFCLAVPARETPRVQECHILVGHVLCGIVESRLFGT
jgi:D-sedoheptulose 7-phosphate isomerase